MCKMLLSINPKYVKKIFNGSKQFEFRKVKCKNKVDSILIYETSPTMKIVGEARIKRILENTPDKIWKYTKSASGISKSFFDSYYKQKKLAIAYELTDIIKFDIPQSLSEYGINKAPQSFRYIYD